MIVDLLNLINYLIESYRLPKTAYYVNWTRRELTIKFGVATTVFDADKMRGNQDND